MKALGIILIVAGIAMFFFSGFSFNTEENIIDAGPIQVNKQKENNVSWPNYAGGISLVAGVIVLVAARKK
ncbi:hypothetical protein Belba_2705 [Belliella baltica DSM 15883]|uniref:DUF3185 domain-containing protein n=1 Tax=Belliella baltica (strain DSM 15883 / CIP 108006 / LMG 21964 / BA134) TaxID=866536 RepID=I3Z7N0_BELBD|nr:hypothetical protein [Belliella baltica]AFL85248.1 hypothetical protein Belba_2705 [Belliella baltica DSM 15883]